MNDIVVIGSGGFSKQVIEIIEEINGVEQQYNIIGIIDDDKDLIGKSIMGYKVIGDSNFIKNYSLSNKVFGVIAIANPRVRERLAEKLNEIEWVNLIHPKAIVSRYIQIGIGNIICAGTVINPNIKIGDHCHINIGCTLGHDITLQNYITLMPGCRISGNVDLKSKSTVGSGAVILQGLSIEKNVVVGAAALLTKNTIEGVTYIGVPAKVKPNQPRYY